MENIEKERHASWLENFYDLIVAIVVFQLSSILNHNVSISGFLAFIALFIPVLWSWMGVTFYNTRFETDDLGHRLLTLLQMAAAAFMAVCVSDGFGKYSSGFALSYAATRAVLVIEYLRTGRNTCKAIFHWLFDRSRIMVYICFSPYTFSFRSMDIRFDYRYFNTNYIYSKYGSEICSQHSSST
jgi:low temperature requirement protein LtrA